MTTPATSKVLPKQELAVTVNANGTEYKVVAVVFNSKGEGRFIDSNSFESVSFETYHTSPFLMGTLTTGNESNMDVLNKLDLKSSISSVNEYGDGKLFLKLKITFLSGQKRNVTLVDKLFVVKNKINTVQGGNRTTAYYFVDVVFNHLKYKRQSWSTDLLDSKDRINQYGEQKVNAGRALKHLLETFTEQKDIVDEKNWDFGIGNLYYTLPANTSALTGMSQILSSYVSSDEGSGILTYYNGKFQLKSLKKHIQDLYKTPDKVNNNIRISSSLAAIFKLQTNDLQQEYTNSSTVDLFGRSFSYIPLDLKDIKLRDIQPDSTVNKLSKNEVIQFDMLGKEFTFHSDQGIIDRVEKVTGLEALPGGDNNKINIDNNNDYNIKNKIFALSDEDSTRHLGTIELQKQLLLSLTKATFDTPGNINYCANRFVYMTLDLRSKNEFAKKIPGFWYIISNTTTLKKGEFNSSIECIKLDKPK